ncbi:MAG: hypothetical protein IJF59_05250, partial [Clostridia bacterium]|nr:hypothetical protein [Clostridia bacterium]
MRNLWEFLLQTANLTLVALFLLLLKRLLRHNLPPRWQYGIWGLFALRALLPASALRQVLLPLSWPLELARLAVERRFPGRFTDLAAPIAPRHPLPQLTALPHSLTDWLFVLYLLGVLLSLVRLLRSAGDLRRLLALGEAPSDAVRDKVEAVAAAHGLPTCRIVLVEDLSTAFVTGVLRPVLVLPAGKEPDELVLLHELLHLRSRDQLQSLLWAGLRALHWCNPLLWPVFDRIVNDMEQFCDQRVLERLEGERRREYGHTLLSMATEQYARAPGTTSIANGSAHIARRIEAIVHFRRYPQGTALAAWCVALMLVRPILWGGALDLPASALIPNGEKEILPALTAARLLRCTTPAGAVDTYAKGLLYQNGVWLAMASPSPAIDRLEQQMHAAAGEGGRIEIDPGPGLAFAERYYGCKIFNLKETESGVHTAQVGLPVYSFSEQERPLPGEI